MKIKKRRRQKRERKKEDESIKQNNGRSDSMDIDKDNENNYIFNFDFRTISKNLEDGKKFEYNHEINSSNNNYKNGFNVDELFSTKNKKLIMSREIVVIYSNRIYIIIRNYIVQL